MVVVFVDNAILFTLSDYLVHAEKKIPVEIAGSFPELVRSCLFFFLLSQIKRSEQRQSGTTFKYNINKNNNNNPGRMTS